MPRKIYNVSVAGRTFQPGAGGDVPFDTKQFEQRRQAIETLFGNNGGFDRLLMMINTDAGTNRGEIIDSSGKSPSMKAIEEAFPDHIRDGRIEVHAVDQWLPNPGSPLALNKGLEIAESYGSKYVLNWSPDFALDGFGVKELYDHAEKCNLIVVGGLRQNWWESPQYITWQNTCGLILVKAFREIGGFAERTAGADGVKVPVILPDGTHSEAPRAGMEDWEASLRLLEKFGSDYRWGMSFMGNPRPWEVPYNPDSEAYRRHVEKKARQYAVMQEWAKLVFTHLEFSVVMNRMMACIHFD